MEYTNKKSYVDTVAIFVLIYAISYLFQKFGVSLLQGAGFSGAPTIINILLSIVYIIGLLAVSYYAGISGRFGLIRGIVISLCVCIFIWPTFILASPYASIMAAIISHLSGKWILAVWLIFFGTYIIAGILYVKGKRRRLWQ